MDRTLDRFPVEGLLDSASHGASYGAGLQPWDVEGHGMAMFRDEVDVLSATWAGLVTIDADCRIRAFNPEAEHITGLAADHVLGQRACAAIWPGAAEDHASCPWRYAIDGVDRRAQPREVTVRFGDRQLELLIGARPTRLPDGGSGAVITFIDISEHHTLERVRAALIADVFHELRSPICSISMAAHFLSADFEHLPVETLRKLLNTIQQNASTLLADLNDLLNRSTFTTDIPTVTPRPFHLDTIVEQVVWKLQPLLEQRGQRVRKVYGDLPRLWVDERRIEQVLVNLVANANKYSVDDDEVLITADVQGSHVRVAVEDHGPGIPAEEQRRVFDRFYRVDTGQAAVNGAGLGLSIVRRIVEAHGGLVGVEDAHPSGARFWMTLPLARD